MTQEQGKEQTPSIKDCFNDVQRFRAKSKYILEYTSDDFKMHYDFSQRLLMTMPRYGKKIDVTPFSMLDREVLDTFRNILIKEGGNPPALVNETDQLQKSLTKIIKRSSPSNGGGQ